MSFVGNVVYLAYDQVYQKNPIWLKGGIAEKLVSQLPANSIVSGAEINQFTGGMLPLSALFLLMSGLNGTDGWSFSPEPGAELYRSEINPYAFYDATTAANSTSKEPLRFEFFLTLPANGPFGMTMQLPVMEMLKALLENHRNLGGVFECIMPIGYYRDCILTDIRTGQIQVDTNQLQPGLVFAFVQPIITKTEGQSVYNAAVRRLSGSAGVAG
jgi:hypothetical protein